MINSDLILDKLELLYPPDSHAFFRELRIGTGHGRDSEQRFDAFSIHYMKGKRNVVTVFEIKTSRSDLLSELKRPLKRRAGIRLSHHFYFVTPAGMMKIEEVPVETGLMEVSPDGDISVVIPAPYTEALPTWQFLASICRVIDKPRFTIFSKFLEENNGHVLFNLAAKTVLDRHLEKWRNINIGSREIPDRIVDALEEILLEVEDVLSYQKKGAKNV
jgi:hypothetical protein